MPCALCVGLMCILKNLFHFLGAMIVGVLIFIRYLMVILGRHLYQRLDGNIIPYRVAEILSLIIRYRYRKHYRVYYTVLLNPDVNVTDRGDDLNSITYCLRIRSFKYVSFLWCLGVQKLGEKSRPILKGSLIGYHE